MTFQEYLAALHLARLPPDRICEVFSHKELLDFFPEDIVLDKLDQVFSLGVLQSAESILESGYGVSFHFLHLTFQEYLAALHLARLPPDRICEVSKLLKGKRNRFGIVWRFFFGIYYARASKMEIDITKIIKNVKEYWNNNIIMYLPLCL